MGMGMGMGMIGMGMGMGVGMGMGPGYGYSNGAEVAPPTPPGPPYSYHQAGNATSPHTAHINDANVHNGNMLAQTMVRLISLSLSLSLSPAHA